MEEQTDFLNIIDNGKSEVLDVKIASGPSAEELTLQELLERKKKLDDEVFACIYCNNSSYGTCNHDSEMAELMKDINEAELNAREK
jgi:hypothetical protein